MIIFHIRLICSLDSNSPNWLTIKRISKLSITGIFSAKSTSQKATNTEGVLNVMTSTCFIYSQHHQATTWGPFHERFDHYNSNLMEILFCSFPSDNKLIAMRFCTWHDSSIVVACAKFSSVMIPYNRATPIPIFHQIWIRMENRS